MRFHFASWRWLVWKFLFVANEHIPNVIWDRERHILRRCLLARVHGSDDETARDKRHRVTAVSSASEHFLIVVQEVGKDCSLLDR